MGDFAPMPLGVVAGADLDREVRPAVAAHRRPRGTPTPVRILDGDRKQPNSLAPGAGGGGARGIRAPGTRGEIGKGALHLAEEPRRKKKARPAVGADVIETAARVTAVENVRRPALRAFGG